MAPGYSNEIAESPLSTIPHRNRKFVETLDFGAVSAWFSASGETDLAYLKKSLPRFLETYRWAAPRIGGRRQSVLDVGAHWLHNAFLYANDGHRLICADVPDTLSRPSVRTHAARMDARLLSYGRLETCEELYGLDESSIDVVLFCEILEHITFNPIRMWKAIYRLMKPGASILLTTPNIYFGPAIARNLRRYFSGEGFGVSVRQILETGTYGHHWKEYSAKEVRRYFGLLSQDFDVKRCETVAVRPGLEEFSPRPQAGYSARRLLGPLAHHKIFAEIGLPEKRSGITIKPPWEPL